MTCENIIYSKWKVGHNFYHFWQIKWRSDCSENNKISLLFYIRHKDNNSTRDHVVIYNIVLVQIKLIVISYHYVTPEILNDISIIYKNYL